MSHPHHGHVFRHQKEADRIIAQVGRKPPETERAKIRETLLAEKEKFLTQARVRTRTRSDGRER